MKLNVLITHVSYQASVSFIKMLRSSKKYDIKIIGCSKIEKGYTCGSMLVDKFFIVPHYDENKYIENIKMICTNEDISLILTADEHDLIMFKKHKLPQALYQYIPDRNIFELFEDKYYATKEIEKLGIKAPQILHNKSDYAKYKTYIRRKRISSCSRGITIYAEGELPKKEPLLCDEYITQPYIQGIEYTVDVFCNKDGDPIMIVPRIRLDTRSGICVRCITQNDIEIINICRRIYKKFKLPGISNVQFIKSGNDVYFIELNPRAAATIISTLRSTKINWLDLYISTFLENKLPRALDYYQKQIYWNTIISRYYEETVLIGESYE